MTEEHDIDTAERDYEEDSKTDVISAVALIGIAVVFMIYWVSNQG